MSFSASKPTSTAAAEEEEEEEEKTVEDVAHERSPDEDEEAGEGPCQGRATLAQSHGRVRTLFLSLSLARSLFSISHSPPFARQHLKNCSANTLMKKICYLVVVECSLRAPPATFPRTDGKMEPITLPEDTYVRKFYQKHPDSKYHDAEVEAIAGRCVFGCFVKGSSPHELVSLVVARVFGLRVLGLKEQGVGEEEAMAVADMEYLAEKNAKKSAYKRLKQIARLQGRKPPPNPYPSAIKEIQAEERKFVRERFTNPKILEIIKKMKEEKEAEMQDRFGRGGW
ncbi:hypothetical protein ACLOJK_003552 [Asimina triloba]